MVPFQILEVVEYVDGRIFIEYETVADDGERLVEGDVFTPDPDDDIEEAVAEWLEHKKIRRAKINSDSQQPRGTLPRVRHKTRRLNDSALARVKARVQQE